MTAVGDKGSVRLSARSASELSVAEISTAKAHPAERADIWTKFLGEWILPADLEAPSSSPDWNCRARAIIRREGCTVAFADAGPQRLVHVRRHLDVSPPR